MITVLHLITDLETGGAEMMLYKLVATSDPVRIRHVVVSLSDVGPVGRRIEALGVPVHALSMRRGVPDPRALVRLLTLMRRVNADVVQTWLYHADLLGLLATMLARTRVPVVWNIRSSYHDDLGRVIGMITWVCARLSQYPAAVVTNSEAAKVLHAELGYRPKQWLVIPNGFDVALFTPDPSAREAVRRELALPADALLIGLVARYHPMKDHRTFLQAAGLLGPRHPDLHFVLIGRDVTTQNLVLREEIEASGVKERVHLHGERADLPRLTAAMDIANCCSIYGESFPNVIGEAMACGVPCVVTDVGDAVRIVGDTGRIVPTKDPRVLAAAWQELFELGPEGRQALGRRARARLEERYSLDVIVRQYETLYERLVRDPLSGAVLRT